jgi:Co/Zn/Cd efflux system component
LGVNAVVIHILGDVLNNLGVIAAALVMMLVRSSARFYADPAVSMAIAIMIASSAVPLSRWPTLDLKLATDKVSLSEWTYPARKHTTQRSERSHHPRVEQDTRSRIGA